MMPVVANEIIRNLNTVIYRNESSTPLISILLPGYFKANPTYHEGVLHSLGGCALCKRRSRSRRRQSSVLEKLVLSCLLTYASRLTLDFLATDGCPPYRQSLSIVADKQHLLSCSVADLVGRVPSQSELSRHKERISGVLLLQNLGAVCIEVLVTLPIVSVVRHVSIRESRYN